MPNKGPQRKKPNIGFVYVLSNPCLAPLKIGSTKNNPSDRARQLSNTGSVPTNFKVKASYAVEDYSSVERLVHMALDHNRVGREFFVTDLNEIEHILDNVSPGWMRRRDYIIQRKRELLNRGKK